MIGTSLSTVTVAGGFPWLVVAIFGLAAVCFAAGMWYFLVSKSKNAGKATLAFMVATVVFWLLGIFIGR